MANRQRFLCRIGFHTSLYTDGAMFTSARRCNWCGAWESKRAGRMVEAERQAWSEISEQSNFDLDSHNVLIRMNEIVKENNV